VVVQTVDAEALSTALMYSPSIWCTMSQCWLQCAPRMTAALIALMLVRVEVVVSCSSPQCCIAVSTWAALSDDARARSSWCLLQCCRSHKARCGRSWVHSAAKRLTCSDRLYVCCTPPLLWLDRRATVQAGPASTNPYNSRVTRKDAIQMSAFLGGACIPCLRPRLLSVHHGVGCIYTAQPQLFCGNVHTPRSWLQGCSHALQRTVTVVSKITMPSNMYIVRVNALRAARQSDGPHSYVGCTRPAAYGVCVPRERAVGDAASCSMLGVTNLHARCSRF
jgi:hypothetical protein